MNDNRYDDEYEYPGKPSRRIWYVLGGLVIAIGLIAYFLHSTAGAHTMGEITYPPNCCNSAAASPTGDCAPIGDQYVTEEPDGYHINLPVGAHPQLKTKGYVGVVPYANVKQPVDNQFHICLSTDGAIRFCFFPKPGSV